MGIERRRYKRVYLRFPVECRGKNIWQKVEADNISEGGMFLITEKIEPLGSPVEIIFSFGKRDKKLIYAEGVVVWNRGKQTQDSEGKNVPAGMGIEFTKFYSLESRSFIAKEVDKWEKEYE